MTYRVVISHCKAASASFNRALDSTMKWSDISWRWKDANWLLCLSWRASAVVYCSERRSLLLPCDYWSQEEWEVVSVFKVGTISGVECASVEVRSSERSCPCLKCDLWAVWSVRVQKCGALWSSERSCLCLKCFNCWHETSLWMLNDRLRDSLSYWKGRCRQPCVYKRRPCGCREHRHAIQVPYIFS